MKASPLKKKTNNVILVRKGTGTTLLIDDHDVHGNPLKQAIRWELDTPLNQGDFISFEWVLPAPATGTFDTPEIAYDGNSLTIIDHNGPGASKNVGHAYVITVDLDGTIYSSRTTTESLLVKDPIIINR